MKDFPYKILRALVKLLAGAAGLAFLFGGSLLNAFLSKPFLPNLILDVVLAAAFGILALLVNALADELEPVEDENQDQDQKPKVE
jgi:predicted outer membrane lipoprotein